MLNQKGFGSIVFILGVIIASGLIIGISFYIKNYTNLIKSADRSQPVNNTSQSKNQEVIPINRGKLSILYAYSYRQSGKDIEQTLKSDLDGVNKTEVNIGYDYSKGIRFLNSKDGKYLLRYDNRKLDIASSSDLSFKTLVQVDGKNEVLNYFNVLWSEDNSRIMYVINKNLDPSKLFGGQVQTGIYFINKDGTDKKPVKSSIDPKNVAILGFNLKKNELYWLESNGSFTNPKNFSIVSLTDGSIKDKKTDLNPDAIYSVEHSPDFENLYYIPTDAEGKDKIIKYSVKDSSKSTLYQIPHIDSQYTALKSYIGGIMGISPDGQYLVFTEAQTPTDQAFFHKEIVNKINLQNNQLDVLNDVCLKNASDYHFSPDGNYLWYSAQCLSDPDKDSFAIHHYLIDLSTKKSVEIFKDRSGDHSNPESKSFEAVKFISWIVE